MLGDRLPWLLGQERRCGLGPVQSVVQRLRKVRETLVVPAEHRRDDLFLAAQEPSSSDEEEDDAKGRERN